MREIKFRGKRKDNREWIYGNLSIEFDNTCHISYWREECTDASVNLWEPVQKWHEVIPETVGQYTGLKDKYCKDICEDDVVNGGDGVCDFWQVIYTDGAFWFDDKQGNRNTYDWLIDNKYWDHTVVGNIHENPGLINPPADSPAQHTMYDPNIKQDQESAAATADGQTTEQATESAEEGNTEG